nr:hypothetical protein [Tanacetum cinerariifolium]
FDSGTLEKEDSKIEGKLTRIRLESNRETYEFDSGTLEKEDSKIEGKLTRIRLESNRETYLEEEREHLINIAKPHTENSTVVDSGMYQFWNILDQGQDETVWAIEKRISDFTFLHVEHGKGLQILHYETTYTSDVEEGGEMVFPSSKGNFSTVRWWNGLS